MLWVYFYLNNVQIYSVDITTQYSEKIPKSFVIIQPLILIFLIILNRFFIFLLGNFLKNNSTKKDLSKNRIIIYGAGDLGLQTLNFLKEFKKNFEVIYFLDDNLYLTNQYIKNVKIINYCVYWKVSC